MNNNNNNNNVPWLMSFPFLLKSSDIVLVKLHGSNFSKKCLQSLFFNFCLISYWLCKKKNKWKTMISWCFGCLNNSRMLIMFIHCCQQDLQQVELDRFLFFIIYILEMLASLSFYFCTINYWFSKETNEKQWYYNVLVV